MGAGRRRYRLLLLPLAVALPMLICFALFVYANDKFSNRHKTVEFRQTVRHRETKEDLPEAVDGRRSGGRLAVLSLQLNAIQRRLQQLVCLGRPTSGTSDTGGWCSDAVGREHHTDRGLARAVSVLLFGRTAASLGDGLGEYGRAIADDRLAERIDAFDGSPFVEETTGGRVRFLDLAVPQYWLPVYDWTLCLEVLEHVPVRLEATALDNLVRPARLGVVLSWARPGQNGFAHVNPRPIEHVVAAMERRGFRVDEFWTTKLRDAATFAWFKFTVNVYRRTNESLRLFDWRTHWTDRSVVG